MRVTAQLIRVRDQTHVWAKHYDRGNPDLLAVETEIAGAIAGEVRVKIRPGIRPQARPANPETYEAYLRGRHFFNQGTVEGLRKAATYFEEAIRRDPSYAMAHDGLADVYAYLGRFHGMPNEQAFTQARAEALKALELDPDLAEAHATYGEVLSEFWDWNGARNELQRALALNPNYALAHLRYAGYLGFNGDMQGALAEMQEARRLDPLSPDVNASLADTYTGLRQYDQAIAQSLRTLEIEKDYIPAIRILAASYEHLGREREAFEARLKNRILLGLSASRAAQARKAFEAGGLRGYWKTQLAFVMEDRDRDSSVPAYQLAWLNAHLGNKEESLHWLETAYGEHDFYLANLKMEPDFDFLRADPRFQSLMQRVGLAQ